MAKLFSRNTYIQKCVFIGVRDQFRANEASRMDRWMDLLVGCHRSRDCSMAQTNGGCHVFEQFVEDGNLIRWTCFYGSKGELVLSEWDCFSIGDKGVLRTMIWKLPEYNIKITNNMRTCRRYIVMDAANPSPPRSIPGLPDSRPAVSSPSIFSSSPIMTLSSTPPCIPYLNHNVWAESGV